MRPLIAYFLKYPVLGNALLIVILVFGYFGFNSIKSTLFPESESRIIQVQVVLPGASPKEVEEGVILKIEDNLKGLSGVERISSISNENAGNVTVEVFKGYDTDEVVQEVKNAVDKIPSFPLGMEPPVVFKQENLNFALSFALTGEVDLKTLKTTAQQVEKELRAFEGISKVSLSGFPLEEIEVALSEDKLRAFNLSMAEVANQIRKANVDVTGGTLKGEREEFLIRGRGKSYFAADLKGIIVKTNADGTTVRLDQVAELTDKWSEIPNYSWYNGNPAVVVTVQNTIDEDILQINDFLYSYLDEFNERYSRIEAVQIRDGSTSLRQRIELLTKNGLIGAILVILFLALFLDHRLAFWVALGIPVSFAGMFILAAFYGLTINVISLFGMILVIGILVDDGIVIAENIYQKFEEGLKPLEAAIEGTLEVLPAVISAIATTVVAFGTFFFLDGRLGDFAPNMAFVVICTLVFSLVEGMLILPAHVAHSAALQPNRKPNKINTYSSAFMEFMKVRLYKPFFNFALQNPLAIFLISLSFFALTIAGLGSGIIKTTFFPNLERNEIDIQLNMPSGTSQEITTHWLNHIEEAVWLVNEDFKTQYKDSVGYITGVQKDLGPSTYTGKIGVSLVDAESRPIKAFDVSNLIREKAGTIYGSENVIFGTATPFGKAVSVALKGYNEELLEKAKNELQDEFEQMSLLKDVTVSDLPGLREVDLKLKPEALALGLQLQDVLSQVRTGFFGAEAQRLQRGEDDVKVWVRYRESDRKHIDQLMDMRIAVPGGKTIPLRELATYELVRGVVGISHLDGQPEIRVEAEVADQKASVSDINAEINNVVLPKILAKYPGIQASFEGQSRQNAKVAGSAGKVMPIVLIIMFAIIVFTFRSMWQAIAVYLLIPFGLIGVGWGHWIHGNAISLLSGFGIIALIGVMVNDSLVFISMVNSYIKKGRDFYQAVYEAGMSRFRPIILTSVTTIAGLAPLILEKSFQAQFLIPMAISVAYGLAIATFTTLILLPALLLLLNTIKVYLSYFWQGKKPLPNEVEAAFIELQDEKLYGNDNIQK